MANVAYDLSVVIPTVGRTHQLSVTLGALLPQVALIPTQIVIVNDSSSVDESLLRKAVVQSLPSIPEQVAISVLSTGGGKGAAGARNFGAGHAQGKYLLFLDEDVELEERAIAKFFDAEKVLSADGNSVVLMPFLMYSPDVESEFARFCIGKYLLSLNKRKQEQVAHQWRRFVEAESTAGNALFMRREVWKLVGPFDENFICGCEDQDWGFRAHKKGVKIYIDLENRAFHNETHYLSLDRWLNRQRIGVYDMLVLCKKYPEGKSHVHFAGNLPVRKSDSLWLVIHKIKKRLCASPLVYPVVLWLARRTYRVNLPFWICKRLMNMLWLGITYRAFWQYYPRVFGKDSESHIFKN